MVLVRVRVVMRREVALLLAAAHLEARRVDDGAVGSDLRRRHPLLLLPAVAKPHPDDLLLQLEAVGEGGDLLCGRLGVLVEVLLECALDADLDGGALLPLAALRRDLVDGGRGARGRVGLRQPLLEQGHELAHVLEAELEGLEPADGRLGEDVAVEGAQCEAHVRLGEAQFDPPLLELLGEGLQVVCKARV